MRIERETRVVDNRVVAVIDDDAAVLDSLTFLLEASGHTVAAFGSATAFLAARQIRPACVIVDHHMPAMTGLELLTRLHDEQPTLPALLITGAPTAAIIARADQLGVRTLEKPPAEDDVLAFVEAHL